MTIHEKLDSMVNNIISGKPIYLGTGKSFNVSSYSGYENFTVQNNFIVCVPDAMSGHIEKYNNGSLVIPTPSCSVTPNVSYNNEIGDLIIESLNNSSGTQGVVVGGQVYGGINLVVSISDPKVYFLPNGLTEV